jgi:hypothetical protein
MRDYRPVFDDIFVPLQKLAQRRPLHFCRTGIVMENSHSKSTKPLAGKTVLVTGGSRGIGAASGGGSRSGKDNRERWSNYTLGQKRPWRHLAAVGQATSEL